MNNKEDVFDVLGVHVSITNLEKTCQQIDQMISEGRRSYICVAPVSTVVRCYEDKEYCAVVNSAAIVTPDGMPLVWLGKKRYQNIERTYGPDLMLALCQWGIEWHYRHFFLGGDARTSKLLVNKLQERFPGIEIVGAYAPPFGDFSKEENEKIITMVQDARPTILWVGLGSPKQDFWMAYNRDILPVPVMIGVGAAFDFIAGTKPQAPRWMQHSGLEWLFRLFSEPHRLWRRYLIGNTKFLVYLLKERLRLKSKDKK